MATKATLKLGVSGAHLESAFQYFIEKIFGNDIPTELRINNEDMDIDNSWIEKSSKSYKRKIFAEFGAPNFISLRKDILKLGIENYFINPNHILNLLSHIDFKLCSFSSIVDQWNSGELGEKYRPPGFADLHWSHGWACAFKGAGHDRLVSKRWLDFGPWRVLRGANDTTLVQFHDLEADPATSLEQAKMGHARMGISRTGGFLQRGYRYGHDLKGIYDPNEQLLKIVIHGREVTQHEMLDACAARYYNILGPEKPLNNVAFVFMEEGPAREHIHELWLRGLECRAIIDGREVRLDEDYSPKPEKPQWVRDVEAREAL